MIPPISSSVPVPTAGCSSSSCEFATPVWHSNASKSPFPPPTPPPSLTPNNAPPTPNDGPLISREKVRDALLMLVQDDQFIDMLQKHHALLKVHHT
ncbi:hypothetical protein M0R45_029874 [Rubus argutus]|uniref:Uncharacterized protein n=1 Tax=Rubus argutus TaxID=59490 RepID=A0AAW1WBB2_RUBAR